MSIQERFCNPISETELKRRWAAVRVAMSSNKLDALIMQGAHNLAGNGGYITSAKRNPELPDVPTMAESGLPEVSSHTYTGCSRQRTCRAMW